MQTATSPVRHVFPGDSGRLFATALVVIGAALGSTSLQSPSAPEASSRVAPRERARPRDERALFELFAASPGFEARYEEEKHLGLLAVPLKSRGRLFFLPPGHLTRIVEEPEPSRVRITPSELHTTSRGNEKRIDLSQSEELRAFVTSLVQVFAGRRDGLALLWTIEYASIADDPRGWTLTLVPRAAEPGSKSKASLARMVSRLELTGEGEFVTRIEVREPSGDRTVTRILEADPERKFSDAERAEFFELPAVAIDGAPTREARPR